MADSSDQWSTDTNKAFVVSLVRPSPTGLVTIGSFKPKFTSPIFGIKETIYGYRHAKLVLQYNASDMRPNLQISYEKKLKTVGEVEITDVKEHMKNFLPAVAFSRSSDFEASIKALPDNWTPPGTLLRSETSKNGTYEIWMGTLQDDAMKQLIKRIQILVIFFIDGGRLLEIDESDADRWNVFLLYEKVAVPGEAGRFQYVFSGYSTCYRFVLFRFPARPLKMHAAGGVGGVFELPQGTTPLSVMPCRSRISQFIVLPTAQGRGNGLRLYGAIYQYYLHHAPTKELTVEDPNEVFDDLRDVADLSHLRTLPAFEAAAKINTAVRLTNVTASPKDIVDWPALEAVCAAAKMAPHQFKRVLEMHLLSRLPDSVRPSLPTVAADAFAWSAPWYKDKQKAAARPADLLEYRLWKLLTKQRLYAVNRLTLIDLSRDDRIEKIGESFRSVELNYLRLISLHASRSEAAAAAHANGGGGGGGGGDSNAAKRKLDATGASLDAADTEHAAPAKKVRIAEPAD